MASLFFREVFGNDLAPRVMAGIIAFSIFGNIIVTTFTASRGKYPTDTTMLVINSKSILSHSKARNCQRRHSTILTLLRWKYSHTVRAAHATLVSFENGRVAARRKPHRGNSLTVDILRNPDRHHGRKQPKRRLHNTRHLIYIHRLHPRGVFRLDRVAVPEMEPRPSLDGQRRLFALGRSHGRHNLHPHLRFPFDLRLHPPGRQLPVRIRNHRRAVVYRSCRGTEHTTAWIHLLPRFRARDTAGQEAGFGRGAGRRARQGWRRMGAGARVGVVYVGGAAGA